jgi:hypothetical protein
MSKITYLLGAGASCEYLPLVKDFPKVLASFKGRLENKIRMSLCFSKKTYGDAEHLLPPEGTYAKDLMESIAWLEEKSKIHASIDTYAKKLSIKSDNEAIKELKKLKATLSCYLLLEQSLNSCDKRYDNFFASILSNNSNGIPSLPDGINIITWNYDTQLEKSYEGFCKDPSFVYKGLTQNKNIIRLNGTCALPEKDTMRFLGYCDFNIPFLEEVIKLFKNFMTIQGAAVGYQPDISFAWEKENIKDEIIETLRGTTTLVIIGYSLPYFNRGIDKMINDAIYPTLNKIFIQVQEKEYQSHKDRLLTIYDDISVKKIVEAKINMVSGTDLFYIPDDMPR